MKYVILYLVVIEANALRRPTFRLYVSQRKAAAACFSNSQHELS
jgi:hypothetical protein